MQYNLSSGNLLVLEFYWIPKFVPIRIPFFFDVIIRFLKEKVLIRYLMPNTFLDIYNIWK